MGDRDLLRYEDVLAVAKASNNAGPGSNSTKAVFEFAARSWILMPQSRSFLGRRFKELRLGVRLVLDTLEYCSLGPLQALLGSLVLASGFLVLSLMLYLTAIFVCAVFTAAVFGEDSPAATIQMNEKDLVGDDTEVSD